MNEHAIAENIRKLRLQAGLTVDAAAQEADITKSTLSRIETGQISPPISTLVRIAKAIGVPIGEFFNEDQNEPLFDMTPSGKGTIIIQDGTKFGYSYEALALGKRKKKVEPFLLTIKPEDPAGEFFHDGQEFIYMLSGRLEMTLGEDKLKLKAGDSLYFDSSVPHKTRVLGKTPARFLCIFI